MNGGPGPLGVPALPAPAWCGLACIRGRDRAVVQPIRTASAVKEAFNKIPKVIAYLLGSSTDTRRRYQLAASAMISAGPMTES